MGASTVLRASSPRDATVFREWRQGDSCSRYYQVVLGSSELLVRDVFQHAWQCRIAPNRGVLPPGTVLHCARVLHHYDKDEPIYALNVLVEVPPVYS